MLMQTNSYIVPSDKRVEHAHLMRRFRQALLRIGCDQFEVYEQVGAEFGRLRENSRFVQILRFRDRKHHESVQAAERKDPAAQDLIREFCELVDLEYQRGQSLFAVGFYSSILTSVTEIAPDASGSADNGDTNTLAAPDADQSNDDTQEFTTMGVGPTEQRRPETNVIVQKPQKATSDSRVPEPRA